MSYRYELCILIDKQELIYALYGQSNLAMG